MPTARLRDRVPPAGVSCPPTGRPTRTSSGYDETSGIIRVNVNAVPVPVTVKDATGQAVSRADEGKFFGL